MAFQGRRERGANPGAYPRIRAHRPIKSPVEWLERLFSTGLEGAALEGHRAERGANPVPTQDSSLSSSQIVPVVGTSVLDGLGRPSYRGANPSAYLWIRAHRLVKSPRWSGWKRLATPTQREIDGQLAFPLNFCSPKYR
jgi:hypothetical protein